MQGIKTINGLNYAKGAEIQKQIAQTDIKAVADACTQTCNTDLHAGLTSSSGILGDKLYLASSSLHGSEGLKTAISNDIQNLDLVGVKPEIVKGFKDVMTQGLSSVNETTWSSITTSLRTNQELIYGQHGTIFDVPAAKLKLSQVCVKVFSVFADYLSNASHELLRVLLEFIVESPLSCSAVIFGGICKISLRFFDFNRLYQLYASANPLLAKSYLIKLFKSALVYGTSSYTKLTIFKCLGYSAIPFFALYALSHLDETVKLLQQMFSYLGIDNKEQFSFFIKKVFLGIYLGGGTITLTFSNNPTVNYHMGQIANLNWQHAIEKKPLSTYEKSKVVYHGLMTTTELSSKYQINHDYNYNINISNVKNDNSH